jgi:hypothetical protein
MKKIFTVENQMLAFHYKNILENSGISRIIKNFYLSGAVGRIPQSECDSELWILDDSDYEKAKILIEENYNDRRNLDHTNSKI